MKVFLSACLMLFSIGWSYSQEIETKFIHEGRSLIDSSRIADCLLKCTIGETKAKKIAKDHAVQTDHLQLIEYHGTLYWEYFESQLHGSTSTSVFYIWVNCQSGEIIRVHYSITY